MFSHDCRIRGDLIWQDIFHHPFVQGIGDGTLTPARFVFYLRQDYLYLLDFSRVLALAVAKARYLPDMAQFANLLDVTLNTEMDLHRRICASMGIDLETLQMTEPALSTLGYTGFLLKTCYEETLPGILAVLLPCAVGYGEIGQRLKQQGLPQEPHLRDWIETYAAAEFIEIGTWLTSRLEKLAGRSSQDEQSHWYQLYLASIRFEYLFFDMSWQQQYWPQPLRAE